MKPVTVLKLRQQSEAFGLVKIFYDLARLTGIPDPQWTSLSRRPCYHVFTVPKKDGSDRLIEDPDQPLKKLQRALQKYLQAVYHFIRTDAAYGFLVNAVDEPAPRHLLSHAQQHTGKRWMLNLDLKDFFHQVKEKDVYRIFIEPPFGMSPALAHTLSKLCSYQGRLPMGAPTSPILSNFAVIPLDNDLLAFTAPHRIRFTRYADDLTFSSEQEITMEIVESIKGIIAKHGYELKLSKFKLRSPDEMREVTGLIVTDTEVVLPDDFIPKMEEEIGRLRHLTEVMVMMQRADSGWAQDYQDAVRGKLSFMSMIRGREDTEYRRLYGAYLDAVAPPEDFEALSWMRFNYPVSGEIS